MKTLDKELVIYDSNCNVCSSLMHMLVRLNILNPSECKSFYDLEPARQDLVNPDRFKNEMAVINGRNSQVLYGPEAIFHIFAVKFPGLAFIFQSRFFLSIFKKVYPILAHNRYVISLPKSWILCDCFPDNIVNYRLQYMLISYFLAIFLTMVLGLALHPLLFRSDLQSMLFTLLIVGSGWALHLIISSFILKIEWYDYAAHLGTIMITGLLVMMPVSIILFAGIEHLWIIIAGVVISFSLMLIMHIRRVKFLQLPVSLNYLWILFLVGCPFAIIFFLDKMDVIWNF